MSPIQRVGSLLHEPLADILCSTCESRAFFFTFSLENLAGVSRRFEEAVALRAVPVLAVPEMVAVRSGHVPEDAGCCADSDYVESMLRDARLRRIAVEEVGEGRTASNLFIEFPFENACV